MRTGSAVGIVMQAAVRRSRRIVLQLATIQPGSGRQRRFDMKDAHRHA